MRLARGSSPSAAHSRGIGLADSSSLCYLSSHAVDNFPFVAMDEQARFRVRPFGGVKSTLLGGEGLVVEVEGPARLWVQTRHLGGLVDKLLPILRHLLPPSSR